MKLTRLHLAIITLLLNPASSVRAADEKLPEWVVGEKEPLPLRNIPQPSYIEVERKGTVLRPKPLTQPEALEKLNPGLLAALPRMRDLISRAKVSPKFKQLYDTKIKLASEGSPLGARSYFDCATVLEMQDAKSGRSVLLLQSDMDTDTDGTDPVRLPRITDYDDARISRSFQPVLAFSWGRGDSSAVNPFPKYFDDTLTKLRNLQREVSGFADADHGYVWQDLKKQFDEQVTALERRANYFRKDLLARRSLVASLDPFIVVPKTWIGSGISTGTYAAVICEGKAYPCIIGDTGPAEKTGEASQRLARAINPKASGKVSAVTTPSVTYLIFPGTRSSLGEPDHASWRTEVKQLLGEIGGLGDEVKLYDWNAKPAK